MTKCRECMWPREPCEHRCGYASTPALVRQVERDKDENNDWYYARDYYEWQDVTVPLCDYQGMCPVWMKIRQEYISHCTYYSACAIHSEIEHLIFGPNRDTEEARYEIKLWFELYHRLAKVPAASHITPESVEEYKEKLRKKYDYVINECWPHLEELRKKREQEEQEEKERELAERRKRTYTLLHKGRSYELTYEQNEAYEFYHVGRMTEEEFETQILANAKDITPPPRDWENCRIKDVSFEDLLAARDRGEISWEQCDSLWERKKEAEKRGERYYCKKCKSIARLRRRVTACI